MLGQGRFVPPAVLAGWLVVVSVTAAADSISSWPAEMLADARLLDCEFVDQRVGWAVGDRGVIWHTQDGGRNWQNQHSGVDGRLTSVSFLDHQNGWIAGTAIESYTRTSHAIVLRTRDGGHRWERLASPMLPGLSQITMLDGKQGWAVGHSSRLYPAGVFQTTDGGRSWSSVPGGLSADWLAADFLDSQGGTIAGHDGQITTVRQSGLEASRTPSIGLRHVRDLVMTGATSGWLVGDRGLAMTTADGGFTWQQPEGDLPSAAEAEFDFAAVAQIDNHIWVAGSPGSAVLHSPDAGRTWTMHRTGQYLPLYALDFVDARHGWAVGALGGIVHTSDGGESWQQQRSGGQRAAVLGIYLEAERIPVEAFARLSAADGYYGAVEVVGRRDLEVPRRNEIRLDQRTDVALGWLAFDGAETATSFPLLQAGLGVSARLSVDAWNRTNDGRAIAEIERRLVRKIRQWRPDVICTEPVADQGDRPPADLINQIVLVAVERAADPTMYTDQLSVAGLDAWQVKKVFETLSPGQAGAVNVATAQVIPALGKSLADVAQPARELISTNSQPGPVTIGFRLSLSRVSPAVAAQGFFAGIALAPGGEARRASIQRAALDMEALRRAAQRRQNVQRLIESSDNDVTTSAAWLGQTRDLIDGLPDDAAAAILLQLASQYRRSGQSGLMAEVLQFLLDEHPEHPSAHAARKLLIQHFSSGEEAHRWRHASHVTVRQVVAESPLGDGGPRKDINVQRSLASTSAAQRRWQRAVDLGKEVAATRLDLYAQPDLRFPLGVAYRQLGLPKESNRWLHQQSAAKPADAWAIGAQMGLWLSHGNGLPPHAFHRCFRTSTKPKLDARLVEAIWQHATPLPLTSALNDDATWPTKCQLVADGQFLYVALECQQAPDFVYEPSDGPRPRDPDLSDQDRVDLLIDLDRDYTTYYRLTVDHRGWTGEACCGDRSWNPKWYVSAATDAGVWTIEAAIPLEELVAATQGQRQAWAVGLQRTVPGVGFQSWTRPAAVQVRPEGFGILVIE